MPRSEFPPVPKSVRLFSVADATASPASGEGKIHMATQSRRQTIGRRVLVCGVLIGGLLLLPSWLGLFESLSRILTDLVGHAGK
jgi:hypothetical protein